MKLQMILLQLKTQKMNVLKKAYKLRMKLQMMQKSLKSCPKERNNNLLISSIKLMICKAHSVLKTTTIVLQMKQSRSLPIISMQLSKAYLKPVLLQ